jgi:hypothetical protein
VKVSGYEDDEDEAVMDADVSSQLASFLPRSLVWLIQRDFLEGSTVNQMVRDALKSVPNPSKDTHVDELNRIRTSLRALAGNSTAFGLRQPHLERTKLCELRDDELEPAYVDAEGPAQADHHSVREGQGARRDPRLGAVENVWVRDGAHDGPRARRAHRAFGQRAERRRLSQRG